MESISLQYLIPIFGLFLIISSFFSGVEAAFVAFDRVKINRFTQAKGFFAKKVSYFIENLEQLIVSILFFNLSINTLNVYTATIIYNKILHLYYGDSYSLIHSSDKNQILLGLLFLFVVTFIILIFGEILPKRIAIRFPTKVAVVGVLPLILVHYFFFPLSFALSKFSKRVIDIFIKSNIQKASAFDKNEFLGYIKLGSDSGALKHVESIILENVFNYRSTTVKSVIIPRPDIEGFDITKLPHPLYRAIKSFPYRYIPIYDKLKDNIIGFLPKSKLSNLDDLKEVNKTNIKKLLKIPIILPENTNIIEALKLISENNSEIAIVTDEYGGVEGIVTFRNIVKKLMGKLESSDTESENIKDLGTGYFIVNPLLSLSEINDYFNTNIFNDKAETLGGHIIEMLNEIPKAGTIVLDDHFEYNIKSSNKRKITKLSLRKIF